MSDSALTFTLTITDQDDLFGMPMVEKSDLTLAEAFAIFQLEDADIVGLEVDRTDSAQFATFGAKVTYSDGTCVFVTITKDE